MLVSGIHEVVTARQIARRVRLGRRFPLKIRGNDEGFIVPRTLPCWFNEKPAGNDCRHNELQMLMKLILTSLEFVWMYSRYKNALFDSLKYKPCTSGTFQATA